MKLIIYKGKTGRQKGAWRWRLVAKNGKIVADSAEGYTSKYKAVGGFITIRECNVDIQYVLK